MKRLPRAMIYIILYLTLLYNLERIKINHVALIDIKGFVYALIVIIIIILLQVPSARKLPLSAIMLITLGIYAIGKFTVFFYWTTWDANSAYLVITEVVLIWLAVLLAYRAGVYMEDFENAVSNISFSDLEYARDLDKTTDDIRVEMYRSRRYNHPLTLAVIEPETIPLDMDMNIAIREVQRSMLERYFTVNMARAIHKDLRLVDTIIDLDKGKRFAILYPETTREKALPLVERAYRIAKEMGISIRAGMASFPENAVTFEELLKRSTDNLGRLEFPKIQEEKTDTKTD